MGGLSWSSSFECRVLEVGTTAVSPVLLMLHQLCIADEASRLCGSRGCRDKMDAAPRHCQTSC